VHIYFRFLQIIGDFAPFLLIFIILVVALTVLGIWAFKSRLSTTTKQILLSSFFTTFLLYTMFCVGEAYFRYVYDQSDALGFLKTNTHWLEKHIVYNNFQLRDNKNYTIAKKSGVTRIGVLGDSFTFGYGLNNVEDRFSNVLEKKLQAAGKKVEVYNLGVSGLDTCGEIDQFKKMQSFDFDIMILQYYTNDIQPCNGMSTGTKILIAANHNVSPLFAWIVDRSYLINYLYWKITAAHQTTFTALRNADLAQYHNPPVVKLETQSLTSISALMKGTEGNKPVVIIIFPNLSVLGPHYPAKYANQVIHQMVAKANFSYIIDLLPDLINKKPQDAMVNPYDNHPNKYVNQLAADKLYKILLPLIK
jgi:hypothetical protein